MPWWVPFIGSNVACFASGLALGITAALWHKAKGIR